MHSITIDREQVIEAVADLIAERRAQAAERGRPFTLADAVQVNATDGWTFELPAPDGEGRLPVERLNLRGSDLMQAWAHATDYGADSPNAHRRTHLAS